MILVVSGATGGHLYPGLAITAAMAKPSLFIVSRQHPAQRILAAHQQPFKVMSLTPLNAIAFPFKVMTLFIQQKPKVIFLMGGFICVPFAIMGWLCRIPMVSFEQNTIPGRATRLVQFFAGAIITTFESTKNRLSCQRKVHCLGNPLRVTKQGEPLPDDIKKLIGKTLLIIGGSQGAAALNRFIDSNKAAILEGGMNIIHLTGDRYFKNKSTQKIVTYSNGNTYVALPYMNNMAEIYKKATHVICRSGATTLSELLVYGQPSMLVPFPFSKDDHQIQNACEFIQMVPNARLVLESDLNLNSFLNWVKSSEFNQPCNRIDPQGVNNSICEFIQSYLK